MGLARVFPETEFSAGLAIGGGEFLSPVGGVDPQTYLADVITRIVNAHSQNRIDELLPWAYDATPPLRNVA